MIVKMKKVTIATPASMRQQTLMGLRDLGVLHIEHVRDPESSDIEAWRTQVSLIDTALSVLSTRKAREGPQPKEPPSELASQIMALREAQAAFRSRLQTLAKEIEELKPLGDFSRADLDALEKNGIHIRVYRVTREQLKKPGIPVPYHVIASKGPINYVFAVSDRDFSLPFQERQAPERGLYDLQKDAKALRKDLDDIDHQLDVYAAYTSRLKEAAFSLRDRLEFHEALSGMGQSGTVSFLQAYCPVNELENLKHLSTQSGWGLLVEEPREEDPVPTLIKNPSWLRMIKPVFDFMGTLPGYREFDVSFWFLASLSIFCAMLIGDGGYGLFFLLATLIAKRIMKRAPAEPFRLLMVMSTATLCWGTMTGTWFGVEGLAKLPIAEDLIIPMLYSYSENQPLMIKLCFLLGAVHLTIAHGVRFVRYINSIRALAEIGWILTVWFLYSLAGHLVLEEPLPAFALYPLILGVFLTSAFSNPQRHFVKSFLLAFSDLPLNVIRSFSDVVSYLRLFAVGYATLVVAISFNQMASDLGWGSAFSAIGAVVILLIGHSLNIVLGGMAVLVHGIRLNMLEFSSHLEMSWAGRDFKPFKKHITPGE
jgi:V/A-type H+-transporting ATPase subunit I